MRVNDPRGIPPPNFMSNKSFSILMTCWPQLVDLFPLVKVLLNGSSPPVSASRRALRMANVIVPGSTGLGM